MSSDITTAAIDVQSRWLNKTTVHVSLLIGEHVQHTDEVRITSLAARCGFVDAAITACPGLGERRSDLLEKLSAIAAAGPPAAPQKKEEAGQGTAILLETPEPCDEAVDGAALLGEMRDVLLRFVELPVHGDVAVLLWVMHTYVIDSIDYSPRLLLTSAEPRSGKSRTRRIIGAMVRRPLSVECIRAAALFRTIEQCGPLTLLCDEVDAWLTGPKADDSLRGLINAGVERGGQVVVCVGDDHEPRGFRVYGPMLLCGIGRVQRTIEDRSIILRMRRKLVGERDVRLDLRKLVVDLAPLRQRCARWAADHSDALRGADPELPACLDDRAADCWRPLVAIADRVGGDWPERGRVAATGLSGGRDTDESSRGVWLLRDTRAVFELREADRLSSKDLVHGLVAIELGPWAEFNRGKPITQRQVATRLDAYGIRPRGIRLANGTTPRGYLRNDLEDAWSRYLGSEVQHRNSPETAGTFGRDRSATGGALSCFGTPQEPSNGAGCCGVALPEGEEGGPDIEAAPRRSAEGRSDAAATDRPTDAQVRTLAEEEEGERWAERETIPAAAGSDAAAAEEVVEL